MTTVIFAKGILATDSRSTVANYSPTHVCLKCNEPADRVKDDASKIEVIKGLWKGENIIAIAGAGVKSQITKAISAIKGGKDIFAMYDAMKHFGVSNVPLQYTLLIVTDKLIHKFSPSMNHPHEESKHSHHDVVAIGSGGNAARLAVVGFGASAQDAVFAAMIGDEGTGGNVDYLECFEPAPYKVKHITDMDKDAFAAHLKSSDVFPKPKKDTPPKPPLKKTIASLARKAPAAVIKRVASNIRK